MPLNHGAIDDSNAGAAKELLFIEVAAPEQRDAQRLKVFWANPLQRCKGSPGFMACNRPAFDLKLAAQPAIAGQRQGSRSGHSFDAWQGGETCPQVLVEIQKPDTVGIPEFGQRQPGSKQLFRLK